MTYCSHSIIIITQKDYISALYDEVISQSARVQAIIILTSQLAKLLIR